VVKAAETKWRESKCAMRTCGGRRALEGTVYQRPLPPAKDMCGEANLRCCSYSPARPLWLSNSCRTCSSSSARRLLGGWPAGPGIPGGRCELYMTAAIPDAQQCQVCGVRVAHLGQCGRESGLGRTWEMCNAQSSTGRCSRRLRGKNEGGRVAMAASGCVLWQLCNGAAQGKARTGLVGV
jgi:hypothetical protein